MAASAPANWAAQIHAEAIASGQASGHTDALGRSWQQRLLDCGYPSNYVYYGSGEALAAFITQQPGGSAGDALASITSSQPGHQNGAQAPVPWECAGIGYASSSGAFKHVWVVVVASAPSPSACPQQVSGTAPTTTATAPATPTPSPTATPSPTPSPTPTARPGAPSVYLGAGWNLVVLPPGPPGLVLARAAGCYRALYQWDGSRWLRYLPGAPDYANNLWTLNGGALWIEGTAANCGLVTL